MTNKKPFFDYIGRLHELSSSLQFGMLRAYEIKGKLEAETDDDTGRLLELTLNAALHTEMKRLCIEIDELKQKINQIEFIKP
jgi:hypothetical protein